jgi:hypothetical protein
LWLSVIILLVKGRWQRVIDDDFGVVFAVIAGHIAPAAIVLVVLGVNAWRRAEPLPSRMTYWSLAASYAMPTVGVVTCILVEAF